MAILNAIRKRTAFLIIIIALALFAFVFSDPLGNSGGSDVVKVDKIGQIGDKSIDRLEFAKNVENFEETREAK